MKRFFAVCLSLLLWGAVPLLPAKGDLSADIKSGAIWEMDQAAFGEKYLKGERTEWVDAEKTTLRMGRPGIVIGELKLGETIIKWKDGKPSAFQIMIYNKGDNGLVDEDEFEEIVNTAQTKISAATELPAASYKPKTRESAVKMKVWQWSFEGGMASLEASSSGSKSKRDFEAEFVRLRVIPEGASGGERAQRSDLKNNVKKDGKRVVIEGIPMVDQGQKGYCAVATAARVFGYYGSDNIDQHELASIANTSAGGGTSSRAMKDAIKKIGSRFQVRIRDIDGMEEISDYQRLVKAYNREARKQKKNQLSEDIYNLVDIWDRADGEILKAVRAGRPADVERWMKPVRTWINMGVPIIWSVQLGLVPEPMRISQSRGGHMRLIIGYDDDKKTILFSDSWGQDHTCKEMPADDAVTITTGRSFLIPSK